MERAARLFHNNKQSQGIIQEEELVQAIWPAAVGKAIARHTGKSKLVRGCLVVEVEDGTWQKQLHALSSQIIERIQKLMGSACVTSVEFRIGIPRREPQRAKALEAPQTPCNWRDDAEEIQDPVLKKVYRLSRKRATA